ncbi:GT-D fold domain-containing glycosyltransferase, partial [Vibrio lentus]
SERLQEILHHESKNNLLICIPPFNEKTNNLKNYYGSLSFWEYYWLNRFENVNQLLSHSSYSNSFVTRETIFYECDITMVKQVWHGRNVTFVYGNNGRFNAEHELFDGIKSKSEILIKPTNAFDDYNSILAECIKYETDTLFLIAAGPTATVLAFDLWKNGFQALDIGHLPNSYDEFLGRIISPEHIPLVSK